MKKTKQELDFHPVKTPKIVVFSSSWSLWALLCTYLSSLFRQTNVSFQFWHLARFASWRQIFIHESWNTCREWFRDDLELWLSLIQTFYLKNFYKKVKIFRQIAIFTRFTTKRQIKKFDFPSNRKVLTWI